MRWFVGALLAVACSGCGPTKPDLDCQQAVGVVTLDGQPLAHADVNATPQGTTMGLGGSGRTNDKGEFSLNHARGEQGLPVGDYSVTVSLRKNPDGSVPPINDPTPPIESPAKETLPKRYVDATQTKLKFSVSKGGPKITLELSSAAVAPTSTSSNPTGVDP